MHVDACRVALFDYAIGFLHDYATHLFKKKIVQTAPTNEINLSTD